MKEFKPTSWSINNKTSIYILTIIISIAGILTYNSLQKEQFPDIVIPTIYVGTVYPGTSPADMENLVTRPLEKNIKAISGVKKITSNSVQDFSSISVEFNTDVDVKYAKDQVKDAVDKARTDLPTDLPADPNVMEVNFADFPIMYVNIAGDIEMEKLKKYSEDLQDKIEGLKEITRVDIVGALDKEIQVDIDLYKMQVARLTFSDIQRALQSENMTISGGGVTVGDMKRNIRVVGQFKSVDEIGNIIIKNVMGAPMYLKDIAQVTEGFEERESYARLDHKPVITLNIVKRSGENLIEASDKIRAIVDDMQRTTFPKNLKVTITADQSTQTRHTLNDLINTIIIGFVLVTLILMFFMGTVNALFVGLSVPISMFLAFMVMPFIGSTFGFTYSLNMIVLFSFLLALGIVVDDAIVVIENTHRIYHEDEKIPIDKAAKSAAGEVFIPVLAGTLTTLAPFFPLLFWPGIFGKFMLYLPVTLILTLTASLLVAFIMNPVFAASFMRRDHFDGKVSKMSKSFRNWLILLGVIAVAFYAARNIGMGNLTVFFILCILANKYLFTKWIAGFQNKVLPRFMNAYARLLTWMLKGSRPIFVFLSIFGLLILSIIITVIRKPKVEFFPKGDPNFVYAYLTMPVGTDIKVTDSVTRIIEKRVYEVIGNNNPDVESVISNVAIGAGDPSDFGGSQATPHKGKVGVAFKEFQYRVGPNTRTYLDKIREAVKGIPVAEITVDQESAGPPTGKPVNIEISGEDYTTLIALAKRTERFIDSLQIGGIEDLRSDLQESNPEIVIDVDRVRASNEGISTAQIGSELRNAIFGQDKPSKFKQNEDEYPIQIRYADQYRKNIDQIESYKITYRDMNSGLVRQIPLSAVSKITYGNSFGGIKRINLKRVITLSSNVLTGYNANEIVERLKNELSGVKAPEGYEIRMTGEQEDQEETSNFLGLALLMSLGLIFFILVTQFNSVSKPIIILTEIIFSIIGVLLGLSIAGMPIVIVMTGVGIVALAGIVVKNGILLVEFADVLKERGMKTVPAIIQAGRTRLNPVALTATATILGLIPLAIGLNINFFTLFSEFKPHFFLGGDSVKFWGPLAWTIIFGLAFATFLTLLVVPVMYLMNYKLKIWLKRKGILSRTHKM